jgi:glycosyltransferase involved in cell wall biosynthesis
VIIAIIPAYNEERHIADVLKRVKSCVDKTIVINDGSKDATGAIAKRCGVIVKNLKINSGKSQALIEGIKIAEKFKPDIIVFMDSDGQHKPEEVPSLVKPIIDGKADFVCGTRENAKKPWVRALASNVIDIWIGGKDILCGFKAMKWELLKQMDLSSAGHYLFEIVLQEEARRLGAKIVYVPVSTIYGSDSKIDLRRELPMFLRYKFLRFKNRFVRK